MIVKREAYDTNGTLITRWVSGVIAAERVYDTDWECDSLIMRFRQEPHSDRILLERGEGVYLCSDEGKTIEVLSRLAHHVIK